MYLNIRRYSLRSRSNHEYECRRTEYEYISLQIHKIWREMELEPLFITMWVLISTIKIFIHQFYVANSVLILFLNAYL